MERTTLNSNVWRMVGVALLAVISSGCKHHPAAYHFKHYSHGFRAIAESNKPYFHSGKTGRIIPKDPCGVYYEPSCFGFEATCWSQWPSECPSNCPIEEGAQIIGGPPVMQVLSDVPTEADASGVQPSETLPRESAPVDISLPEAEPPSLPVQPVPQSRAPVLQPSPTIPVDIESSIPSPSDATRKLQDLRRSQSHFEDTLAPITTPNVEKKAPVVTPPVPRQSRVPRATAIFKDVSAKDAAATKVQPPKGFRESRKQQNSKESPKAASVEKPGSNSTVANKVAPKSSRKKASNVHQSARAIQRPTRAELPATMPELSPQRLTFKTASRKSPRVPTQVVATKASKKRSVRNSIMTVSNAPKSRLRFAGKPSKKGRMSAGTNSESSVKFR